MSDRAPSAALFVNTATVINPTVDVEAGTNARKPSYGGGTAGIKCSIQVQSADAALRWGRLATEVVAMGYFPEGTTIAAEARITQTDKTPNQTYRVIGPGFEGAGRTSHVQVRLVAEVITNA